MEKIIKKHFNRFVEEIMDISEDDCMNIIEFPDANTINIRNKRDGLSLHNVVLSVSAISTTHQIVSIHLMEEDKLPLDLPFTLDLSVEKPEFMKRILVLRDRELEERLSNKDFKNI